MGRPQQIERLAYTVPQFMAATGYSRNKTYAAIARGDLRSFKDGKRRMISADAAREFIARRERETAEAA
jgi:Helix-turn-helix domain